MTARLSLDDARYHNLMRAYYERLAERPAFQRAKTAQGGSGAF